MALEKLKQRVAGQLGIQFYSFLLGGELATDVVGGLSVTDLMEEFGVRLSSYCQSQCSLTTTWLPVISLKTAGSKACTVSGSESVLRGHYAVILLIPATMLREME